MGILSKLFGRQKYDDEMFAKFEEFEEEFEGDQEIINLTKALWLTSRGNSFCQRGKFDLAISDFNQAKNIKKDHILAYIGLGLSYKGKGMFEEALNCLSQAPEKTVISGKDFGGFEFDLYNIVGSIYLKIGNRQKAIYYIKKAVESIDSPERKKFLEFSEQTGIADAKPDDKIMKKVLTQVLEKLENNL